MGLFDKLKSLVSDDKKDTGTIEIIAPLSGEIVNIEDVPDVVFAEKIVGDGIAIKPTGNKMVAPVDGTIGKIFETNHAFSIESDSGVELFVHFGIDTVELKGEGFKRIAEEGQRVKVGDTVIEFDLPLLEEKAKSTLTPVVISNMDEIKELIKLSGSVTVGETPVAAPRSRQVLTYSSAWTDNRSTTTRGSMPASASFAASLRRQNRPSSSTSADVNQQRWKSR